MTTERARDSVAPCLFYTTKITEHYDRADAVSRQSVNGPPRPETLEVLAPPDFVLEHARGCASCCEILAARRTAFRARIAEVRAEWRDLLARVR